MNINDTIISSLHSLKLNFDFVEIWNNRKVAIRDLSPFFMYYPNEEKVIFYEVFANPEKVSNNNGKLTYNRNNVDIDLSLDIDNQILNKFTLTERIQIAALHQLVQLPITEAVSEVIIDKFPMDSPIITLKNGMSIGYSIDKNKRVNLGQKLEHKIIMVSNTSRKKSKVGDYFLEPGQMTFGIFCGCNLVDVSPPHASNNSYYIEFEKDDDKTTLVVTDIATSNIVTKYYNPHYFTLFGDNEFIVIDGSEVKCLNNNGLNNRLKDEVVKSKSPEFLILEGIKGEDIKGCIIHVIYNDNSEEIIQI